MRRTRTYLVGVVLAGIVAVLLAGCDFNFTGVNLSDELADYLLAGALVADVRCDSAAMAGLPLGTDAVGNCMAFNADTTRIAIENYPVARWRSTNPTAVQVALDGKVYPGSVADTAWIVAEGAKYEDGTRSADSVQVRSY